MTILSMNQAAKLFRVSRNTIKSKLEQGVLSYAQGGTGIDLSELIRVFGATPEHALIEQGRARQSNPAEQGRSSPEQDGATSEHALTEQVRARRSNPTEQGRATPEQAEIGENRAKIAALEVEVRLLRERLDECQKREEWMRGQIEKTQRLLEYKPELPAKKAWKLW